MFEFHVKILFENRQNPTQEFSRGFPADMGGFPAEIPENSRAPPLANPSTSFYTAHAMSHHVTS